MFFKKKEIARLNKEIDQLNIDLYFAETKSDSYKNSLRKFSEAVDELVIDKELKEKIIQRFGYKLENL